MGRGESCGTLYIHPFIEAIEPHGLCTVACANVSELNGLIVAIAGKGLTIGAETDGKDGFSVSLQDTKALIRLHIPQPGQPIALTIGFADVI